MKYEGQVQGDWTRRFNNDSGDGGDSEGRIKGPGPPGHGLLGTGPQEVSLNAMHLDHPETIPAPHPSLWEDCLA